MLFSKHQPADKLLITSNSRLIKQLIISLQQVIHDLLTIVDNLCEYRVHLKFGKTLDLY
jgi:hypothetical protein